MIKGCKSFSAAFNFAFPVGFSNTQRYVLLTCAGEKAYEKQGVTAGVKGLTFHFYYAMFWMLIRGRCKITHRHTVWGLINAPCALYTFITHDIIFYYSKSKNFFTKTDRQ